NKHRNFKNLPKTCAKRHHAWECAKDYHSDGSLSSCVLGNAAILQYVKSISGDTLSDAAQFDLPMSPTYTAKIVTVNGITYTIGTVLYATNDYLSDDKPKYLYVWSFEKKHALLHPDRFSSSSTPLTTPQTSRTVTSQIANASGDYSPGSKAATLPSTTITQNQTLFTQETSFFPSQLAYLLSQVTTPRLVIPK
ncbi:unnamed protein product, partial [Didymodactylos carnosus]